MANNKKAKKNKFWKKCIFGIVAVLILILVTAGILQVRREKAVKENTVGKNTEETESTKNTDKNSNKDDTEDTEDADETVEETMAKLRKGNVKLTDKMIDNIQKIDSTFLNPDKHMVFSFDGNDTQIATNKKYVDFDKLENGDLVFYYDYDSIPKKDKTSGKFSVDVQTYHKFPKMTDKYATDIINELKNNKDVYITKSTIISDDKQANTLNTEYYHFNVKNKTVRDNFDNNVEVDFDITKCDNIFDFLVSFFNQNNIDFNKQSMINSINDVTSLDYTYNMKVNNNDDYKDIITTYTNIMKKYDINDNITHNTLFTTHIRTSNNFNTLNSIDDEWFFKTKNNTKLLIMYQIIVE